MLKKRHDGASRGRDWVGQDQVVPIVAGAAMAGGENVSEAVKKTKKLGSQLLRFYSAPDTVSV